MIRFFRKAHTLQYPAFTIKSPNPFYAPIINQTFRFIRDFFLAINFFHINRNTAFVWLYLFSSFKLDHIHPSINVIYFKK